MAHLKLASRGFIQVLKIHCHTYGKVFPIKNFLLTSKDELNYITAFECLLEFCESLKVKTIITDFESFTNGTAYSCIFLIG